MTEHRDDDDTPADSPYAKRLLLDDGAPVPKPLERRPPPMTPLPPNPTDRDFAQRFATVSEWHYEQHPILVKRIEAFQRTVDEMRTELRLALQLRPPRQWPQYATFGLVLMGLLVLVAQRC